MPPSEPSRVFISYARKDGASLAQRLESDLRNAGLDAWLDTQRIKGGAVWSEDIDRAIDSCQVMIAVLTTGSYESGMCRGEQLRALDKGKRLVPVLAEKGADRTTYLYRFQYRDFTNDSDYLARLAELISDIRGDATATLPDAYRKTRVTYLTAPPRVANYLERPEALHALRDALFAEDHRQPIALTALHGMGGIGKTVLAKALTDDQVVQRAFPDGIVWITAGHERQRDFTAEMREVAKALGDDLSRYENDEACKNQYRTTIASKAALIVVDDVWSKAGIDPLLAESPRSRFLFTTRDAAIGNLVGARDHRADLLDDAQSRELLALWANQPFPELPAVADEIIRECGRLPLALSVLGGMLRGKNTQYWADTLVRLRKADISSIRKQLPTGQETFFKAVETSFRSLEPEMQEQYKALAVLLEDMPAPLPILATLWNVDASDARLISNRLVELSLAQLEGARLRPRPVCRQGGSLPHPWRAEALVQRDRKRSRSVCLADGRAAAVVSRHAGDCRFHKAGSRRHATTVAAVAASRSASAGHSADTHPLRPRWFGLCSCDDPGRAVGGFRLLGHHAEGVGFGERA